MTLAHIRLVRDSPTVIRACALLSNRPLIGCSPTAVANPVRDRVTITDRVTVRVRVWLKSFTHSSISCSPAA
jgi:hypothetical protein